MLAGFVVEKTLTAEPLEKDAVTIEGAAEGGHGAAAAAPEIAAPILGLIATADIEKGAKISKACASCHSFDKDGATKTGPALWNIVGRAKGSVAGYDYSDGLKAKGGNWDIASLNQFLWKPKKYVSDTKMTFNGISKEQDRAALIAWLRAQADSPVANPTEEEIKAEADAFAPKPAEGAAPTDAAAAPTPEGTATPEKAEEKPAEKTTPAH